MSGPGHVRAAAGEGGFSLVELLVAMVLGVMLIGGTTTIFRGNVRSAELGRSIATMQANARFALDEMATRIRAAGARGCASVSGAPLAISTADAPLDDARPDASALGGVRVGTTDWALSLPDGYTPPSGGAGVPVSGTDMLMVQHAAGPGETLLAAMDSAGSALEIEGRVFGLEPDDLAVITDCTAADLFRVDTRTGTVGAISLKPDRTLSRRYRPVASGEYPRRVSVLPFSSDIYYVGDTGRLTRSGDAVRALYLQTFPHDPSANPPLELVEGVDQLQLAFGVRRPGGVRFVAAGDPLYDPARISSVRVGLLTSSNERLDEGAAARTFSLAGRTLSAASGEASASDPPVYPADRRLRLAFERGVTVRNRALENPS